MPEVPKDEKTIDPPVIFSTENCPTDQESLPEDIPMYKIVESSEKLLPKSVNLTIFRFLDHLVMPVHLSFRVIGYIYIDIIDEPGSQ